MIKKIRYRSTAIAFDDACSRYFTLGKCEIHVFDANTDRRITSVRTIAEPCMMLFLSEPRKIFVMNTEGKYRFHSADDFSEISGSQLLCSDPQSSATPIDELLYDESQDIIYCVAYDSVDGGTRCKLYKIYPETARNTVSELPAVDYESGLIFKRRKIFHPNYKLFENANGGFYASRSLPDKPYVMYGKFEEENGTLVLKQKMSEDEMFGSDAVRLAKQVRSMPDSRRGWDIRLYRNERGVFFIRCNAIYRATDGEPEIVYDGNATSSDNGKRSGCRNYDPGYCDITDYVEHRGRGYICTFEGLFVQDINP